MTSVSSYQHGKQPRIGITVGDPAGIGAEVSLKAVCSQEILSICTPVLIGAVDYLKHWATTFNLPNNFHLIEAESPLPHSSEIPLIYNLNNIPVSLAMGREQAIAGKAAGEYIEAAVKLCLQGELDAITTAPINKSALHLGGYDFPGHTEMLAHLSATKDFAMSFVAPNLRVALLTTHLSLADAIRKVKQEPLQQLICLVDREMKRIGFDRPKIAVAALNPHGGEGGMFGTEETTEMLPAILHCRNTSNIEVSGPYSGDTIFVRAAKGEFDIVISCYHDQGLIPIKCFAFGEAVNVTMGLPFIRTSVDHGTAFDIAGQGKAEHGSMMTAIKLAVEMVLMSGKAKRDQPS